MKKSFILSIFFILILSACSTNMNNNDRTIGPNNSKIKIKEQKTMVPNLSDDYPDYYAKCLQCGHIWRTQSEEMCSCGNFDNVEVYDLGYMRSSKLYNSLPQEDLIYADIDRDLMVITIGYSDSTSEYHKYDTKDEIQRDQELLWEACGPAEYIYHGEIKIDPNTGKEVYSSRDIIIYNPQNYDITYNEEECHLKLKNGDFIILPANIKS